MSARGAAPALAKIRLLLTAGLISAFFCANRADAGSTLGTFPPEDREIKLTAPGGNRSRQAAPRRFSPTPFVFRVPRLIPFSLEPTHALITETGLSLADLRRDSFSHTVELMKHRFLRKLDASALPVEKQLEILLNQTRETPGAPETRIER
ncbi:MAG: hypothetical protein AB1742_03410 [bacterium]